jgi:membrane peptidoglycan carboxypeptidase
MPLRTLVTISLVLLTAFLAALPNVVLWNPIVRKVYAFDLHDLHSAGNAEDRYLLTGPLRSAFLAVEDPQFYARPPFDPLLVVADRPFDGWSDKYAGSTFSYELTKIVLLHGQHISQPDWIIESGTMIFRLEHELTKDEILNEYLDRVPLDANIHGVQAASAYLFDKSPNALTLAETIYLIATTRNGSCRMRRNTIDLVVDRLGVAGILDAAQAKAAADQAEAVTILRTLPRCATRR